MKNKLLKYNQSNNQCCSPLFLREGTGVSQIQNLTSPSPVDFVDSFGIQRRNKFHIPGYLLISFLLPFLLFGTSCNQSHSQKNIICIDTVSDSYDREVAFTDNPQRIISAAPGITEIIFALGEQKRLIGRTEYCDFPPEVASIP